MFNVLSTARSHKHRDRLINLNPKLRVERKLKNRLNVRWTKFHEHRQWLCNHHIPVGLRLGLFDGVVSPSVLFGGLVLPLSEKDLKRFDIVQRRMLRLIVGWRRTTEETWEDTMRRMEERMKKGNGEIPDTFLEQSIPQKSREICDAYRA